MKYIIILGDGMADEPLAELQNKTPLQIAKKPNMDFLARNGELGLLYSTPEGMPPGSDITNLSILGYDPNVYYTGRSFLEAVSIGIGLKDTDITYRCNLVTLSDKEEYDNKIMVDYSSDEISTKEAGKLIGFLKKHFDKNGFNLYPGFSYRHCLKWENGKPGLTLTPPHDILDKRILDYLPKGENSIYFYDMMKSSYELLKDHPVNKKRIAKGLRPGNSVWFWGEAKKMSLPSFYEKYGKKGAVISAVDLIKGIGISAGMKIITVKDITGTLHTNYEGKAGAALNELKSGADFVFVHIEAPDECGHRFEIKNKIKAIEHIDGKVLGNIMKGFNEFGEDYAIAVLPDHPTPLRLRTHTTNPVPYIIYRSNKKIKSAAESYDELQAKKTGIAMEKGHMFLDRLFNG